MAHVTVHNIIYQSKVWTGVYVYTRLCLLAALDKCEMVRLLPRHSGLKWQDTCWTSFLCFRVSLCNRLWHPKHLLDSLCEACPVFICRSIDELVDVIFQIWDEWWARYIFSAWMHSTFWIKLMWSFRFGAPGHRHEILQTKQTNVSHTMRKPVPHPNQFI